MREIVSIEGLVFITIVVYSLILSLKIGSSASIHKPKSSGLVTTSTTANKTTHKLVLSLSFKNKFHLHINKSSSKKMLNDVQNIEYDDEIDYDKIASDIVTNLLKCKINFLAIDFDLTMISQHTAGRVSSNYSYVYTHIILYTA